MIFMCFPLAHLPIDCKVTPASLPANRQIFSNPGKSNALYPLEVEGITSTNPF